MAEPTAHTKEDLAEDTVLVFDASALGRLAFVIHEHFKNLVHRLLDELGDWLLGLKPEQVELVHVISVETTCRPWVAIGFDWVPFWPLGRFTDSVLHCRGGKPSF